MKKLITILFLLLAIATHAQTLEELDQRIKDSVEDARIHYGVRGLKEKNLSDRIREVLAFAAEHGGGTEIDSDYVLAKVDTIGLVATHYFVTDLLNDVLISYVTLAELNTALANYSTTAQINTLLANYVTNSSLATTLTSYVTSASLTSTLNAYLQKADSTTRYITPYYLFTSLQSYTTNTKLTDTLNYVRNTFYKQLNDGRELIIGSSTDNGSYNLQVNGGAYIQGGLNSITMVYSALPAIHFFNSANRAQMHFNLIDPTYSPIVVSAGNSLTADLLKFYFNSDSMKITSAGYLRGPVNVYSTGGYSIMVWNSTTRQYERITGIAVSDVTGLQTTLTTNTTNIATNTAALITKRAIDTTVTTVACSTSVTLNQGGLEDEVYYTDLNCNISTVAITNLPPKGVVEWVVKQDATGGRTIAGYPSGVVWDNGTPPIVTADANRVTVIYFRRITSTLIKGSYSLNNF